MPGLLLVAETDGDRILQSTLPAAAFAQQWAAAAGGPWDLLVVGGPASADSSIEEWRHLGARTVVLYEPSPETAHPLADRWAALIAVAAQPLQASAVAGPASTFGRDILPRVAGLLDWPMLSDVLSIERRGDGLVFRRPMYAGNLTAEVRVTGDSAVYGVRGTAFGRPAHMEAASPVESRRQAEIAVPQGTEWVSLVSGSQERPDLTAARVVVSGGRPLRDAATFDRLIGGLADRLGGAAGATRAAVDSGIAPNELQVGQTGKVVAPDLYIAAGISGSVQHLAGMKDSKVIVAVNTDPDAPIFGVADYGLVADLHQALPEMIDKLQNTGPA